MLDVGADGGEDEVAVIPGWKVLVFQLFTVLSYANSAVNPLLYVFVNENFRQNCLAAIRRVPGVRGVPSPVVIAAATPTNKCRPVVVRLPATSAAAAGVGDVQLHASL